MKKDYNLRAKSNLKPSWFSSLRAIFALNALFWPKNRIFSQNIGKYWSNLDSKVTLWGGDFPNADMSRCVLTNFQSALLHLNIKRRLRFIFGANMSQIACIPRLLVYTSVSSLIIFKIFLLFFLDIL